MSDPTCKDCKATLKWKMPYVQGERPVNTDGSAHNCKAAGATGGKYTSAKFSITKATEIYNLAESMLDSFKLKRGTKGLDGLDSEVVAPIEMALEQEAIFIESMFRTITQGFKE